MLYVGEHCAKVSAYSYKCCLRRSVLKTRTDRQTHRQTRRLRIRVLIAREPIYCGYRIHSILVRSRTNILWIPYPQYIGSRANDIRQTPVLKLRGNSACRSPTFFTSVTISVIIFVKNCHQKPDFMAKIHQIQFRLGLCPRTFPWTVRGHVHVFRPT